MSSVGQMGYVASMATKLSDTFASEIGKAYGMTCVLITTLKPVGYFDVRTFMTKIKKR